MKDSRACARNIAAGRDVIRPVNVFAPLRCRPLLLVAETLPPPSHRLPADEAIGVKDAPSLRLRNPIPLSSSYRRSMCSAPSTVCGGSQKVPHDTLYFALGDLLLCAGPAHLSFCVAIGPIHTSPFPNSTSTSVVYLRKNQEYDLVPLFVSLGVHDVERHKYTFFMYSRVVQYYFDQDSNLLCSYYTTTALPVLLLLLLPELMLLLLLAGGNSATLTQCNRKES